MPVEEVEEKETKLVEETTRKEIVVCDSCGINEDSDSKLYQFSCQSAEESLYFCTECLNSGQTQPVTERLKRFYDDSPKPMGIAMLVSPFLTIFILGFQNGGFVSALAGIMLFLIILLASFTISSFIIG